MIHNQDYSPTSRHNPEVRVGEMPQVWVRKAGCFFREGFFGLLRRNQLVIAVEFNEWTKQKSIWCREPIILNRVTWNFRIKIFPWSLTLTGNQLWNIESSRSEPEYKTKWNGKFYVHSSQLILFLQKRHWKFVWFATRTRRPQKRTTPRTPTISF